MSMIDEGNKHVEFKICDCCKNLAPPLAAFLVSKDAEGNQIWFCSACYIGACNDRMERIRKAGEANNGRKIVESKWTGNENQFKEAEQWQIQE